ncbi:MAG: divergent polysaccharide deacetylase family protein [Candidatus Omnitrophota bacterium]
MNKKAYIAVIVILALTTLFYWHRSREYSTTLRMIQVRIEESKRTLDGERALRESVEKKLEERQKREAAVKAAAEEYVKRYAISKDGAKIAIVLDDWGYNQKNLKSLLAIEAPITLSVLPNLPYSRVIAEKAHAGGKEVILHLPLEPHEAMPLENNTITSGMVDEEALENLNSAILSIPHLKGVSNHMGSKATEDAKLMLVLLDEMKREGLYFLDSLVTTKSVCSDIADAAGVKFASRSVFLDNELDSEYIKEQIMETARQALQTGQAIGIGHDRAITIKALAEMVPKLREMGIEIVPVSEIVK